jgi:hypothetical protein
MAYLVQYIPVHTLPVMTLALASLLTVCTASEYTAQCKGDETVVPPISLPLLLHWGSTNSKHKDARTGGNLAKFGNSPFRWRTQ